MTLKAVPFFTQLSDRELDVVRAVAAEKNYPKNAVVLTEGEMGDSLYMIQSGKVKVFIGDEDGREIILKILGPGRLLRRDVDDRQAAALGLGHHDRGLARSSCSRTRRSRNASSRRRASATW